jgi:hypothetical protein
VERVMILMVRLGEQDTFHNGWDNRWIKRLLLGAFDHLFVQLSAIRLFLVTL